MMPPFFTVVIPTYNRAELLRESIQSVLNQTFKNFEMIIVDDHSIDNTKESVDSFSDNRINYIINDHAKGAGGARNAGIFRAKGEWVAFLDSDDLWLSNKLDLLYKKIQEVDNTTGLIYTGYSNYDFDTMEEILVCIPEKEGWLQNDLLYRNFIGTFSTVAIRSIVLRQVHGLDEEGFYFEDGDLYVRVAGLSKITCIKEKLTYYRTSNIDKFSCEYEKRLEGYKKFREKHKGIINNNLRIRHRAASRVFVYAVVLGEKSDIFKVLPWTFAGLLFDFSNFIRTFRTTLALLYKGKQRR